MTVFNVLHANAHSEISCEMTEYKCCTVHMWTLQQCTKNSDWSEFSTAKQG